MAKRTLLTEIYNSVPTILYEGDDEQLHTAENGYECDEPDCICHWERATQNDADIYGTHPWNCRCQWCEPTDVLK